MFGEPGAYSVATATDPALIRLRERVEWIPRRSPEPAEIAVTLRDGRVVRANHDLIAMSDVAAQATLAAKFDALAHRCRGAARARELR